MSLALAACDSAPSGLQVETARLDNGLEIIVIPDFRADVVTHMLWYRTGSADEPLGKSGIAHFFEHLMFRGTENIPPGEFSKTVARLGGQDNAFTSYDYTAYFQRVHRDKLGRMMEMEAERMQALIIEPKIVAVE
ncbi:MAG: M16 family metallopeptidase, partial [Parvibaculales bacterium]